MTSKTPITDTLEASVCQIVEPGRDMAALLDEEFVVVRKLENALAECETLRRAEIASRASAWHDRAVLIAALAEVLEQVEDTGFVNQATGTKARATLAKVRD